MGSSRQCGYVRSIYLTVHLREEGTASEKRLHGFFVGTAK